MSEIILLKVNDTEIKKIIINDQDYLCISDFVPKENTVSSGITIINWLSTRKTIEFL